MFSNFIVCLDFQFIEPMYKPKGGCLWFVCLWAYHLCGLMHLSMHGYGVVCEGGC